MKGSRRRIVSIGIVFMMLCNFIGFNSIKVNGSLLGAPEQPSGVSAFSTETSVTVNWNSTENAISYNVTLSGDMISTTSTSHTFTNLDPGTEYTFSVQATGLEGDSGFTSPQSIYTLELQVPIIPDTPKNIIAQVTDASVALSWEAIADAVSYNVLFDHVLHVVNNTTFSMTNLEPETEYTYQVQAVGIDGNSDFSDLRTISTLKQIIPIPETVTHITATSTETSVTLIWDSVQNADKYSVIFDNSEFVTSSTGHTFTDLASNTSFTYKIAASNETGQSSYSTEQTIMTKLPKPAVPNGIVYAVTSSSISIIWNSVEYATEYTVMFDGIPTKVLTTTFTQNQMLPNTVHTVQIKASNLTGSSAFSEEKKISTQEEIPLPPTNVSAVSTLTSVVISWTEVEYAKSYLVTLNDIVQTTTSTSITFGQLLPNTIYSYSVKAKNGAGISESSATKTIRTLQPATEVPLTLSIPTSINAVLENDTIIFSWSEIENAAYYEISINGELKKVVSTRFILTDTAPDTIYEYVIRAANNIGKSAFSSPKTIRTNLTAPESPIIAKVTVSDTAMIVTWNKVEHASSYEIILSSTGYDDRIKYSSTNEAVFSELMPDTLYSIKIRAVNRIGSSPYSSFKSFRTPKAIPKAPIIKSVVSNSDSISLTWNPVPGAVSYEVLFNGISYTTGRMTYIVTDLQADTLYAFSVRAINEAGKSLPSVEANIKTRIGEEAITLIGMSTENSVLLDMNEPFILQWNKVNPAASYTVSIQDANSGRNVFVQTTTNRSVVVEDENLPTGNYRVVIKGLSSQNEQVGYLSHRLSILRQITNILTNADISIENSDQFYVTFDPIDRSGVEYVIRIANIADGSEIYQIKTTQNQQLIDSSLFDEGTTFIRLEVEAYQLQQIIAIGSTEFEINGKDIHLERPKMYTFANGTYLLSGKPLTLQWAYEGMIAPDQFAVSIYKDDRLYYTDDNMDIREYIQNGTDNTEFDYSLPNDIFKESGKYMIALRAIKRGYEDSTEALGYLEVVDYNAVTVKTNYYTVNKLEQVSLSGTVLTGNIDDISEYGFLIGDNQLNMTKYTVTEIEENGNFSLLFEPTVELQHYYYRSFVVMKNGEVLTGNIFSYSVIHMQSTEPKIYSVEIVEDSDISGVVKSYSIITDKGTQSLVFIDNDDHLVKYESGYTDIGEKRVWRLERSYKKQGVFIERIYALNPSRISEVYYEHIIVTNNGTPEEFADITTEAIPTEPVEQKSVHFLNFDTSVIATNQETKVWIDGSITCNNDDFIRHIALVDRDTVHTAYKYHWLSGKETSIDVHQQLSIVLASMTQPQEIYVYVELDSKKAEFYKINIIPSSLIIECKPFITVGDEVDLRLYLSSDESEISPVIQTAVITVSNTTVANANGQTLTALKSGQLTIHATYVENGVIMYSDKDIWIYPKIDNVQILIAGNIRAIHQQDFNEISFIKNGSAFCALASVVNSMDLSMTITPLDIINGQRENGETYGSYYDAETESVGKLFANYLFDKGLCNVSQLKYTSFSPGGLAYKIVETITEEQIIIAGMGGTAEKETSSNSFTQTNHYVILNGIRADDNSLWVHVIDSDAENYLSKDRLLRWYDKTNDDIWIPMEYIVSDITELNILN